MPSQESRKHHYVPELLLRPWLTDTPKGKLLSGHYWDPRAREMRIKRRLPGRRMNLRALNF
jgi:hypothetical protein